MFNNRTQGGESVTKNTMKKKATEHWQYIESVLDQEIPSDQSYSKREYIEGVGKHYCAALVHGMKHGVDHERRRN
jgi:hypothetical protein